MFRVVIPARYASTRLPGKPLRVIGDKPMIQHVYERAQASGAAEVWLATDDARIEAACRGFGARVALTSPDHQSGTDRIAELAARERWDERSIVVGVQGDEPLLPPGLIGEAARLLESRPRAGIATLGTPVRSLAEFLDPNVVKAVVGREGLALYFSRAPIPWSREGAAAGLGSQTRFDGAVRHIGLYAYRVAVLKRFAGLPASTLEQTEKLEQLRALECGIGVALRVIDEAPPAGVDTEEDLTRVQAAYLASMRKVPR